MYFSAKAQEYLERDSTRYGLMLSYKPTGGQDVALKSGCLWMLDNGAFSGNFNEGRWMKQMESLASSYATTCRGIIAPDAVIFSNGKFVKGDWEETRARLKYYSPLIRSFLLPVAYALQDDHPLDEVPWGMFETLFIAGTSEYKESAQVEAIAKKAKQRGKWVHVGRVSQVRRMDLTWWADSWDGTTFKYGDRQEKHVRFTSAMLRYETGFNQWRLL